MTCLLDSEHFYRVRDLEGLVVYTCFLAGTGLIKHLGYLSQTRLEHIMSDPGSQQWVAQRTLVLLVVCIAAQLLVVVVVAWGLRYHAPVIVPIMMYDGIIVIVEIMSTMVS